MIRCILLLSAGLLVATLTGCSTLDPRSTDEADRRSLSPEEIRTQRRAEQVQVGFTRDQVRQVLGDPHGVVWVTTEPAERTIWSYFHRAPRSSSGPVPGRAVGAQAEKPWVRITFDGDRVIAIEHHPAPVGVRRGGEKRGQGTGLAVAEVRTR